mgnify:CR=1 FL=1
MNKKYLTASHALQNLPTIKPSIGSCIGLVLKFDKNAHLRDGFQNTPVDGLISNNRFKRNSDRIPALTHHAFV